MPDKNDPSYNPEGYTDKNGYWIIPNEGDHEFPIKG